MLWYGTEASIPTGWHVCDGTVGTPNLKGIFVMGAGGVDIPGTTGGAAIHTHAFTGDGHSHDLPSGASIKDESPLGDLVHHTDTSPASGDTDIAAHLPPYHKLCYIMKL